MVSGPRVSAATASALAGPVAIITMRRARSTCPIPIVSARAGTRAGSPPNRSGVGRARRRVERRRVGVRVQARSGLVEADVAVGAEAEHEQVDAAGRAMARS